MNFWSVIYDLCEGFGMTLKLFALTLVIAIPLGLLFCFCSPVEVRKSNIRLLMARLCLQHRKSLEFALTV